MKNKIIVWVFVLIILVSFVSAGNNRTNLEGNCSADGRAFNMEDNALNTIVVDSSGNTNGISTSNTDTMSVSGIVGNALNLTGLNEFINTSFGSLDMTTLSLSCFINMQKMTGTLRMPISNLHGGSQDNGIEPYIADGTGELTVNFGDGGGSTKQIITGHKIPNNKWVHLGLTFTDGEQKVYLNGTLTNTASEPAFKSSGLEILLGVRPPDAFDSYTIYDNCYFWRNYVVDEGGMEWLYNDGVSNILFTSDNIKPTITIDYPSNNSKYNFGVDIHNYDCFINVTINENMGNITLNDSRWVFNSSTINSAKFYNTDCNTELTDDVYQINITANDTSGNREDVLLLLRIDTISPDQVNDITNTTFIVSGNFTYKINMSDETAIYSYNITRNGVLIDNQTGLNDPDYEYNGSIIVTNLPNGEQRLNLTVCDPHTANEINDYRLIKTKDSISFDSLIVSSDKTPKSIKATKLIDRYSFSFEYSTPQTEITLNVPKHCDYIKGSTYKGHFVCGNKWVDFEGEHDVFVNGHTVTIRSATPKKIFNFNSVGELNCNIYELGFFTKVNSSYSYIDNVIEQTVHIFNFIVNAPPVNVAADFIYNNSAYATTKTTSPTQANFSISFLVPRVQDNINNETFEFYFNYSLNDISYNSTFNNQTVYKIMLINCSGSDMYTLNISFRNSSNDAAIETNFEGTFSIQHNPNLLRNYSFDLNSTDVSLCIYPNWAFFETDAIIEYEATGYTQRTYYLNGANLTNTTTTLILYHTGSTEPITATVRGERNKGIESVDIKVLEYDIGTGNYKLVQIGRTNFEGQSVLQLVKNIQFYRFILEYEGEVKKITDPTYIYEDTIDFSISIEDAIAEDYYKSQTISYALVYNNDTQNFRLDYSDGKNVLSRICLRVEKEEMAGSIYIGEDCLSTSSGTILIGITDLTGTYKGTAFIGMSPTDYFLDSIWASFADTMDAGNLGVLLVIFITVVFAFAGIWNLAVAVVLVTLPALLGSMIGLISIGKEYTIPIFILSLIIGYLISDKT